MPTLLKQIRAKIVQPSGRAVKVRVNHGENFSYKGQRYEAANAEDLQLEEFAGFAWHTAIYQKGVPKARPYWIQPSPGLTGDDFENIDGEWLVKVIRQALKDDRAEQIKLTVVLFFAGGGFAAASLGCWFAYKIAQKLGA